MALSKISKRSGKKEGGKKEADLRSYARKRDFTKTPEPRSKPSSKLPQKEGEPPKRAAGFEGGLFIIQKHAATRLHFDFRVEMEGVLKSWAVPKGIPLLQGEKHLAIRVEDHPLEYAHFEGTIPKGEYGGGTVMIWDIGRFQVLGGDALAALESGRIHLQLNGNKLHGEWALVRTHLDQAEGKESWMLIKTKEDMVLSGKGIKGTEEISAVSGRSMEEIGQGISVEPHPSEGATHEDLDRVTRSRGPFFIPPMKAKLVDSLPDQTDWIYELKFDGYRAIALKSQERVQLYSRNKKLMAFSGIAEAIGSLPCATAIIDGEIVALDDTGRPTFQLLQSSDSDEGTLCYYVFDLLFLNGQDLRSLELWKRKEKLLALIAKAGDPLRFSGALPGNPTQVLNEIKARGLEGIVAKRRASRYEPGIRSGAWVKIKCLNEQEFVIGGYTLPKGTRSHFGSLLVGYYDQDQLRFAGKVGTGFSEQLLRDLIRRFSSMRIPDCPFSDLPSLGRSPFNSGISVAEMKRCTWIRPELVCQVRFTEWTREGKLRQPVFLGLRPDKNASEAIREET